MGNRAKKSIVGILILSLLLPSFTFFLYPNKAEAGTADCLAGVVGALGLAGVASFLGVPTGDKGNLAVNAGTNISTTGSFVKNCIIIPLVQIMVRSLLQTFTNDMVRWINSGFQGSPLFVTNPTGFLADVADQTIGQYIQGLGPIGQIVCSPFDLQLRLSLNLLYTTGYQQEIHCRLTDIQKNVQRAFTSGIFGPQGWNNWLAMTSQPQNNIYGSYLNAVSDLDVKITGRYNIQLKQLDWGRGFLSSQRCAEPLVDLVTEEQIYDDKGNPECYKWVTETPGSVIESQLNQTLPQPLKNLGLAQDIDAILGALVGQMIKQVVGGVGGLLGATSPSSSGGSPIDFTKSAGASLNQQIANNNTAMPSGIRTPDNATDPQAVCTWFNQNVFYTKDSSVVYKTGVNLQNVITTDPTQKSSGGSTVPWTVDDYNQIRTFCQNYTFKNPLSRLTTTGAQELGDKTGQTARDAGGTGGGTSYENTGNIALNKETKQDSTFYDYVSNPSGNAVDGTEMTLAISNNTQSPWWEVNLGTDQNHANTYVIEEIDKVEVVPSTARNTASFRIYVSDSESHTGVAVGNGVDLSTQGLKGPYVIVRGSGGYLSLAEVRVFGKQITYNSQSSVPNGQSGAGGGTTSSRPGFSLYPSDRVATASFGDSSCSNNCTLSNNFTITWNGADSASLSAAVAISQIQTSATTFTATGFSSLTPLNKLTFQTNVGTTAPSPDTAPNLILSKYEDATGASSNPSAVIFSDKPLNSKGSVTFSEKLSPFQGTSSSGCFLFTTTVSDTNSNTSAIEKWVVFMPPDANNTGQTACFNAAGAIQ